MKKHSEYPSYISIGEKEIKRRGEELFNRLSRCDICPKNCFVNRLGGSTGVCKADDKIIVSSYNLHFGEELPISGWRGSGAIFFTNCSLKCKFCLNYRVSQLSEGEAVTIKELTKMMVILQRRGAHNINLVTPTHYLPFILLALSTAIKNGLKIPIVYNISGYERVEILKYLDGIVDIYLPDVKYYDNKLSEFLSLTPDYPKIVKPAIIEMFRQVGPLKTTKEGIAERGLIIRHLILPNHLANSKKVLLMIKKTIGTKVTISLMDQYFPAFKMIGDAEFGRRITKEEYKEVRNYMREIGFTGKIL